MDMQEQDCKIEWEMDTHIVTWSIVPNVSIHELHLQHECLAKGNKVQVSVLQTNALSWSVNVGIVLSNQCKPAGDTLTTHWRRLLFQSW